MDFATLIPSGAVQVVRMQLLELGGHAVSAAWAALVGRTAKLAAAAAAVNTSRRVGSTPKASVVPRKEQNSRTRKATLNRVFMVSIATRYEKSKNLSLCFLA